MQLMLHELPYKGMKHQHISYCFVTIFKISVAYSNKHSHVHSLQLTVSWPLCTGLVRLNLSGPRYRQQVCSLRQTSNDSFLWPVPKGFHLSDGALLRVLLRGIMCYLVKPCLGTGSLSFLSTSWWSSSLVVNPNINGLGCRRILGPQQEMQ